MQVPSEVIGKASTAGQRDARNDPADVGVSHKRLTSKGVASCVLHSDRINHRIFLEINFAESAGVSSSVRNKLEAA